MGLSQSNGAPEGGTEGYHVHGIQENSPAERAGLDPFFDFIISIGNNRLNQENDMLKDLLKANVEKSVKMEVYSTKTMRLRELEVVPSNMWGGQGLLGASVRFCSFQGANENVWHVLDVEPSSPAALAGFREHADFIVGADQVLQDVSLMAASRQAVSGLDLDTPLPPPIQRVMDPGFSDQSEVAMMNSEMSDMADRLDLSVSSIDMTSTSLAVREDIDISGVEELHDSEIPYSDPKEITEESPSADLISSVVEEPSPPPSHVYLSHPQFPNTLLDHNMPIDMSSLVNSSIPSFDSVPPIDISSLHIDRAALRLQSSALPAKYPLQPNEFSSLPSKTDGFNQGFSEETQSLKISLFESEVERVSSDLLSPDSCAEIKDGAALQ
ncbi:Golgi reassembly-stacking protein 2-like isoform X4 [Myxocyprinus asiaticus]|uniref:Golgi reassembly-stacking protein 2-like isoform X4 n=1 Tax=Myxocyprinus asiaticus TaxID=70543 RepID=UPI002222C58E|nr:Golgi reassembly-stacking protein 2-like isoform X4 [Myxocyprinus asiaticus]